MEQVPLPKRSEIQTQHSWSLSGSEIDLHHLKEKSQYSQYDAICDKNKIQLFQANRKPVFPDYLSDESQDFSKQPKKLKTKTKDISQEEKLQKKIENEHNISFLNQETKSNHDFSYSEIYFSDEEQRTQMTPKKIKQSDPNRKKRTMITQEKLQQLNRLFQIFQTKTKNGEKLDFCLKDVSLKLNLAYSTILHKRKEFLEHKEVKKGARLECKQNKLKYKKSLKIEQLLIQALNESIFYNAVQLSKHIFFKHNLFFSRAIISRHLAEIGFSFNNFKPHINQMNSQQTIDVRYNYVKLLTQMVVRYNIKHTLFVDQWAYSVNDFSRRRLTYARPQDQNLENSYKNSVSVLIAIDNKNLVHYAIKQGFFTKQDFVIELNIINLKSERQKCENQYGSGQTLLITDLHRIHKNSEAQEKNVCDVSRSLKELNLRRIFLPPYSPQLNPCESFFRNIMRRLRRQGVPNYQSLLLYLRSEMKRNQKVSTNVYFKDIHKWTDKAWKRQRF